MCRKDFVGYFCGHCSVPTVVECPLAMADPMFPRCGFVAENPTRNPGYCPPCHRAAHKLYVLEQEKNHREMHENGMCPCDWDFTEEERERRRESEKQKRIEIEKHKQKRRAQLVVGKDCGNGTEGLAKSAARKRRQRNSNQGNCPQVSDNQNIGQPQDLSHLMENLNLDQFLNAPYGQYQLQALTPPAIQLPMQPAFKSPIQPALKSPTQPEVHLPMQPAIQLPVQPVSDHQQFYFYPPQHTFFSMGVPSMIYYQEPSTYPFINGVYDNTEPMFLRQPLGSVENRNSAPGPYQYSAEDPCKSQELPVCEEGHTNGMGFINSAVVSTPGQVQPSPAQSFPKCTSRQKWDSMSQ